MKKNKFLYCFCLLFLLSITIVGCYTPRDYMKNTALKNDITQQEDINVSIEFYKILDNIKSTHPGTAGCSLQALNNAKDILNISRAKLPLDAVAVNWATQYEETEFADIKESFEYFKTNLEMLKNENDKKIFDENDVENYAPYNKILYETSLNIVNAVIKTCEQ